MSKKLKRLYAELSADQRQLLELHIARDYAQINGEKRKAWGEIAKELGVVDRTVRKWKADPIYKECYRIRSMAHLDHFLGEVNSRLVEAIRKGAGNGIISVKALELYYKVAGHFENRHVLVNEESEDTRDVEALRKKADELLERFSKDGKENNE